MTDAQVERYSRQIVLPEIGARGQERLLGAAVGVAGTGAAAVAAAALLGRAGVGTLDVAPDVAAALPELPPECRIARVDAPDVVVDVSGGRGASSLPVVRGVLGGTSVIVTTLVGRPCAACVDDDAGNGRDAGPLAAPAALALGALAASEALRVLLCPADARVTTLDVASGTCVAARPATRGRCALCGADA
jgi:hypothetical protein